MFEGHSEGVPAWPMPGGAMADTPAPHHKRPGGWWNDEKELPRLISECHISPTKRQRLSQGVELVSPVPSMPPASAPVYLPQSQGVAPLAGDLGFLTATERSLLQAPPLPAGAASPPTAQQQSGPSPTAQLAIVPFSPSLPTGAAAPEPLTPMPLHSPRALGQPWPPLSEGGSLTEWGKHLIKGGNAAGEMIGAQRGPLGMLAQGKPIQIKGGKSLTEALDLVGTGDLMLSQGSNRTAPFTREIAAGSSGMEDDLEDDKKDSMES